MLLAPEKSPGALPEDRSPSLQFAHQQAGPSNHLELPPAYDDTESPNLRSPPPGQRPGSPSFLDKLKSRGGVKPSELLDPPPPSFTRPVAANLAYEPFPQCSLQSLGNQLDKGWPLTPPQSFVQPHLFVTHDVQEEDWTRFLRDMKKVGTLSPMNQIVANLAPLAMGLGFYGIFVTRIIQKRMKRKKVGPASELLEYWNHYFFRPRAMEVTLIQGYVVPQTSPVFPVQGYPSPGYPPQYLAAGPSIRRTSSISSSSSSSSDEKTPHRHDTSHLAARQMRRAEKRERRAVRRERKAERREERRAEKAVRKEKWHLIISYVPQQQSMYAPGSPAEQQSQSAQPSPAHSP